MATTISTQDIVNAKRDIDDIGKAVNEKTIVSPRYGGDFKSLPMIAEEFQISSDAAEAAAVSAAESAGIATSAAQNASSSANIAEAAATSATISAGVFETPEAGVDPVTGVANGAYFNVRSSSDESYVDEYQNVGGVPKPTGKGYPSSAFVQDVRVRAPYFFNTVSAMVSANNISDGMVVGTKGYHNVFDEGGAIYLISSTATDYSIPLANGLHAVFRDTFDIRKFGIVSSPTVRQDANLIRMRNYADSRVYTIDFLGFDIVTPDSNAGISGREKVANGLWFEHAHHYKNLNIYNDKSERLETGKCCLIFCPTKNPDQLTEVIYENINLDPWNDNYQPFSENYLGAYDGMRHGIFIHPKEGVLGGLYDSTQASNFIFTFKNIIFKSMAYSYNVTQSALRSKRVRVDGMHGDCFLMLNYDAIDMEVLNLSANVRFDKKETGRLMVMDAIHSEPENTGKTDLYTDRLHIANSKCYRTNTDLTVEAGQLLWITSFAPTIHKLITIENSHGAVSLQSINNTFKRLIVKGCRGEGIWVGCNNTTIDFAELENCDIKNFKTNPGFVPPFYKVNIKLLKFTNSTFVEAGYLDVLENTAWVDKVVITGCNATNVQNGSYIFIAVKWREVEINNCDFTKHFYTIRHGNAITKIRVNNSSLGKSASEPAIGIRYSAVTESTDCVINNSSVQYVRLAGTAKFVNCNISTLPRVELPEGSGTQLGTNAVIKIVDNLSSPALTQVFTVNQSVPANNSVVITKTISAYAKDVAIKWSVDPLVNYSVRVYGTTVSITLTNTTAASIAVNSECTLVQLT